jgi:hypothetical protein
MLKRKALLALGLTAAALTFAGGAITASSNNDQLLKDEKHFLEQSNKTYEGGQKGMQISSNLEVVAHDSLGDRGFNGDVWAHEGYAYIGHWGFQDSANGSKNRFCPDEPNSGVAVVKVDGSSTTRVSTLQNPAGTSAEDVVVYSADDGRDIAVAGIQWCGGPRDDPNGERGLMLWDVSNPADPHQLGYLKTACCARGVHEFEVERHTNGHTYAYATVPTSRYPDSTSPTGYRDRNGDGDFRLIDITDPSNPTQVSDWGVQDAGGPWTEGQGCDPDANYGHGAEPSADGKTVYLSYWDSGFIKLNLTNPATPVFKGRTVYPANADGDGHSSNYDDARKLLFTADEDFCPNSGPATEKGWGYLRVYDYANAASPRQIGSFRTQNSLANGDPAAGDYTIHNPLLVGTDVYTSWYSDGVRIVDASVPTNLREVGYFVPPAGQNPVKPSQRGTLSQTAQVWGVVVEDGLIYASDMNTGLWVLQRK